MCDERGVIMLKNNYYRPQIEAVLEYLENNMDSNLSLNFLAKKAGFSPYHFHRIFRATTGKTLHEYVLSRKLNKAASMLLYENSDITKIALDSGFSTPSAFAKCFKEMFGSTPSEYKVYKSRKYPVSFSKISFPEYVYDASIEDFFCEILLPDLKALCIGVTGLSEAWENPEIQKAYDGIFRWLKANPKHRASKICGITIDTPEVKALEECMYYACAAVDEYIFSEALAFRSFKTSGKYVCCKMNRSLKDFPKLFFKYMDYLYGFYLQKHQLSPDSRPFVEFYEQDLDKNIIINFCVPVKKSNI